MAEKKSKKKKEQLDFFAYDSNIVTKSVEQVIHESMLPYSEYVIMDRALPRVEDGLKPVQRRVLYSMLEVGVLPDRPFRKSARIVGDCMGKYHPHGDKSIYDTMVRMAQPFNMGEILVNGHGNFGSVDGDCAAAMRYTEAKLAPIALELLRDIDKDTIPWMLNFDDSCKEPVMLPGRFPNLLVNGAYGIAVGLATNIPTHNLKEACLAVCAYIDNRNITTTELMQIMPAPDFPTGAYILNNSELKQLYETGKGKVVIRSKCHVENAENGKKNIVITEIPYQVNKSTMLQRIATLKEANPNGCLSFIADILDESDRNGTRAVIKLKKDAKVNEILNFLYKNSDLQSNFNANMVAIADGKPKQLSLIEILDYYVNFQQKVIYNRTKFDLEACLKKEHILEGLLIAINNIDEVIKIIKTSKSVTDAKIRLIETFSLSDVQAQAILDMRLARLTNLEVNKLIAELNRLKDLIKRFTAILKSEKLQMKIVKEEIMAIANKYGKERQTQFLDCDNEIDDVDFGGEISDQVEEVNVIISPENTIKNVATKNYNMSSKTLNQNASVYEIPEHFIQTESNKAIYLFTNIGNCIRIDVSKLDQCKFKDRGANLTHHYKNFEDNERVISVLEFSENNSDDELLFVTKLGMVKVSKISEYFASKQSIAAIKLKESDELINVQFNSSQSDLLLVSQKGYCAFVPKSDIQATGRVSVGFKGIALGDDDKLICGSQCMANDLISLIFNNGNLKSIKVEPKFESLRNKKGIKIIPNKLKDAKLSYAGILKPQKHYVVQTNSNNLVFINNSDIKLESFESVGKAKADIKDNIKNVFEYIIL